MRLETALSTYALCLMTLWTPILYPTITVKHEILELVIGKSTLMAI